jgi:hypothetical protein
LDENTFTIHVLLYGYNEKEEKAYWKNFFF